MQAGNAMMIPWMKRMAATYHDRSKVEKKKKAMSKQEKEREISKIMRGDAETPLAALRRKYRCPRWQPLGTITTDTKGGG